VLRAHVWACDDGSTRHTSTTAAGDAIVLHLPDGDRRLPQVIAASRAKYEDASTVFWTKGAEATVERKPGAAQTCREQRALSLVADAKARGVTFRGSGNEPGWLLEIGPDDTLTFEDRYGGSRVTYDAGPAQTAADGSATYVGTRAADTIRVTLRQQSCQDSMSGDGFPTTVEVEVNGQRRQGCGTNLERER
jgi:putative lipoprotein